MAAFGALKRVDSSHGCLSTGLEHVSAGNLNTCFTTQKYALKPFETWCTSTYCMNYAHLNASLEHSINGAEPCKLMSRDRKSGTVTADSMSSLLLFTPKMGGSCLNFCSLKFRDRILHPSNEDILLNLQGLKFRSSFYPAPYS